MCFEILKFEIRFSRVLIPSSIFFRQGPLSLHFQSFALEEKSSALLRNAHWRLWIVTEVVTFDIGSWGRCESLICVRLSPSAPQRNSRAPTISEMSPRNLTAVFPNGTANPTEMYASASPLIHSTPYRYYEDVSLGNLFVSEIITWWKPETFQS